MYEILSFILESATVMVYIIVHSYDIQPHSPLSLSVHLSEKMCSE